MTTHAELVITAAAHAFGFRGPDILSKSRSRTISRARQAAVWILRTHLRLSFPEIGRAIGYEDHSSAMRAWENVSNLMLTDTHFLDCLRIAERTFFSEKTKATAAAPPTDTPTEEPAT